MHILLALLMIYVWWLGFVEFIRRFGEYGRVLLAYLRR